MEKMLVVEPKKLTVARTICYDNLSLSEEITGKPANQLPVLLYSYRVVRTKRDITESCFCWNVSWTSCSTVSFTLKHEANYEPTSSRVSANFQPDWLICTQIW